MKENVGTLDRAGRAVVGPALLLLGYGKLEGRKGRPLGLLAMLGGAALIESAITRVCPTNAMLGLDTREPPLVRRDFAREFSMRRLHRLTDVRP